MIKKCVEKLIRNLPKEARKMQTLDVVFDGGAFNGSYLVGASYFLKSMERKSYIKIDRISSYSVGSFISLLYVADCLDLFPQLYKIMSENFKKSHHLNNFRDTLEKLKPHLPKNICELMTNKVYITFCDLKKNKKVIKSKYSSIEDIFETIHRSCFLPILMNGELLYKNRYVDGFRPFIFKIEPNKKILFLNLITLDKVSASFNIKNEKTNYHRVLSGLLDIHNFYIKDSPTQMCSYVNNWGLFDNAQFALKKITIYLMIYLIRMYMHLKEIVSPYFFDDIFGKIIGKTSKDVYSIIIEHWCF